jgi:hypothetical protein
MRRHPNWLSALQLLKKDSSNRAELTILKEIFSGEFDKQFKYASFDAVRSPSDFARSAVESVRSLVVH